MEDRSIPATNITADTALTAFNSLRGYLSTP